MRVALVQERLDGPPGAAGVPDAFAELYPDADLHVLACDRGSLDARLAGRAIRPSFLQWMPGARRNPSAWRLLQPLAVAGFDLEGYDLVLSSSASVAKGAKVPVETLHVCYCLAPLPWAWGPAGGRGDPPGGFLVNRYRAWDLRAAAGVDAWIVPSVEVRDQVRRIYVREAAVIPPPGDSRPRFLQAMRDFIQQAQQDFHAGRIGRKPR